MKAIRCLDKKKIFELAIEIYKKSLAADNVSINVSLPVVITSLLAQSLTSEMSSLSSTYYYPHTIITALVERQNIYWLVEMKKIQDPTDLYLKSFSASDRI